MPAETPLLGEGAGAGATHLRVRVELTIGSGAEVPSVGIKTSLQNLTKELPENPTPINARLAQTLIVDIHHTKLLTEIYRQMVQMTTMAMPGAHSYYLHL